LKKILIILSVIALLFGVFIIIIYSNKVKGEDKKTGGNIEKVQNIEELLPSKIDIKTYYMLENSINKYFDYIAQENSEGIYNILDSNYIEDKKITKDNVLEKIRLSGKNVFTANKIEILEESEYNKKFYVQGKIYKYNAENYKEELQEEEEGFSYQEVNMEDTTIEREYLDFNAIVYTDLYNMTFSIIPNE